MSISRHDRGMAFEAMVIYALNEKNGCLLNPTSQSLFDYRDSKVPLLSDTDYQQLLSQSRRLAETIPALARRRGWYLDNTSVIEIARDESRRSKVYDILIWTAHKRAPLEISIKTNDTVEDKSYRFNTQGYTFSSVNDYVHSVLGSNPSGTWKQALDDQGYTVTDFLSGVVDTMVDNVSAQGRDHDVLAKLTSERFIGDGGYIKTLSGGGSRWYPHRPQGLPVITNPSRSRSTTFSYDAVYHTVTGPVTYRIDFRVKFKDGKNKPVRINDDGSPANIAATVRILEIIDQDYEEIL